MAAIPTLDTFDGAEAPLATDWTSALDSWLETGGVARPTTYATDSAISWSTALTEVDTAGTLTGAIVKVTLGALTAGSELRIYGRATNADDVTSDRYYVKIKKSSLTLNNDNLADEIELWKIVSGTHTQLGTGQTLKLYQESTGHLRQYELVAGSEVTLMMLADQIFVKVSAQDIDGYKDVEDWIVVHVQDTDIAVGAKYIGLWNIGSTHTNSVQTIQGGTFTGKWVKTTGSDAAAGTRLAPYATPLTLTKNVSAGEVGIISAGTYGSMNWTSDPTAHASGTSWEDAIVYTAAADETVNITSGFVPLLIKDIPPTHYEFLVFKSFRFPTLAKYQIQVFTQNADTTPSDLRFQDCYWANATDSGFLNAVHSSWNSAAAYTQRYHIVDNEMEDNGTVSHDHGLYAEGAESVVEFNESHHNAGDGFKWQRATNDRLAHNTIIRHNLAHDNSRFNAAGAPNEGREVIGNGFNWGKGNNMKVYGNRAWNNSAGFFCWGNQTNPLIFNNIAHDNFWQGMVIYSGTIRGGLADGHKIYNNTCIYTTNPFFINTGYNFEIEGAYSTEATFTNNIAYGAENADYKETTNANGSPSPTLTTNLEENNPGTGFGSVYGDPLFANRSIDNYRLQVGSPAINAGTDVSVDIISVDFEGRTRSGTWDIGAFEFDAPGTGPVIDVVATKAVKTDTETDIVVGVSDVDNDMVSGYAWVQEGTISVITTGTVS